MNHRRRRPRYANPCPRSHSSDWSYPQVEKGKSDQSRHSVAERAEKANNDLKEYLKGSEDIAI